MMHIPRKERLWSRDLALASLAILFLAVVFYLLITTMTLYAVERFGASDTQGGLAASMFIIGAVVARLFAGNLTDLFGRRTCLVVSTVAFALLSLAYLPVDRTADSLGVLLVVRTVHGAAFAVASTASMALAATLIPPSRRAEGTGYFTLGITMGAAIGPFVALMLVHGPGYGALFVVATVASVLGMVAAVLMRTPDQRPDAQERARLRRFRLRDMLHPTVLPVASFTLVMGVGYSGVLTFLNSYGEERGLQLGVSLFFPTYAVGLALTRLVAGRLQDLRGANPVVYVCIAVFTAGLGLLGVAGSTTALVVSGALVGIGFGTLTSAMQAIAVAQVPVDRVGSAVSTHFFMLDLGLGAGPVVLGLALTRLGYDEMYLALAVLVALSAVLYHVVHGRGESARRRTSRAPSLSGPVSGASAAEPLGPPH